MLDREARELVFLLALIAIVFCLTLNPNLQTSTDSAAYISMAKNFWETRNFEYQNLPVVHLHPGLPLLLSPFVGLCGDNYLLLRLLNLAHGLGGLAISYFLVRKRTSHAIAMGTVVLAGFSYATLFEVTRILTDLPFFFWMSLSLLAMEYAHSSKQWLGVLAVSLLASYFLRPTGILLPVSYALFLVCHRKEYRLQSFLPVGIAVGLPILAWTLRNQYYAARIPSYLTIEQTTYYQMFFRSGPNSEAFVSSLSTLFHRVGDNLFYNAGLLSNIVSGYTLNTYSWLLGIPTLLLFTGARIRLSTRRIEPEDLFLVAYFFVLLFWPWQQGERFLVPILPVLFYPIVTLFCENRFKPNPKYFVPFIFAFSLLVNARENSKIIQTERHEPYYSESIQEFLGVLDWIEKNLPKDARIVGNLASWIQLKSERVALEYPRTTSEDRLLEYIDQVRADFVVLSPIESTARTELAPLLVHHPDRFSPIYQIGDHFVFVVRPKKNGTDGQQQ